MADEIVKEETAVASKEAPLKDAKDAVVGPSVPAEEPVEIKEDPNAWKKGLGVLGAVAVLFGLGGFFLGRATSKKGE